MSKRAASIPERPFLYCHFENINILSTKTGLVNTLKNYYAHSQRFKGSGYTYEMTMAVSCILPGGSYLDCPDISKFRRMMNKFEKKQYVGEKLPCRQLRKNLWIMKPENENRGRGIELISNYKQLLANLAGKLKGETFIIQKYIERPLLYQGRKFDIRVLALIDNDFNFYRYK